MLVPDMRVVPPPSLVSLTRDEEQPAYLYQRPPAGGEPKDLRGLKQLFLESHSKDFDAVGSLMQLETLGLRSITLPDLSVLTRLGRLPLYVAATGEYAGIARFDTHDGVRANDQSLTRADATPSLQFPWTKWPFLSVRSSMA